MPISLDFARAVPKRIFKALLPRFLLLVLVLLGGFLGWAGSPLSSAFLMGISRISDSFWQLGKF